MITNRLSNISAGLLILAVAFVGVSFVTLDLSSKKASGIAGPNTYLPLPPGKQTMLFNAAKGGDDFYQRHPNWSWSASTASASYPDYFQRHPELSKLAILGQGASDYFERHPELSARAASSVDLTDYYFRNLNK